MQWPRCHQGWQASCLVIDNKGFSFVRIDFYNNDEKLYFGEMTFTPAGGMFTFECLIDGRPMGGLLDFIENMYLIL
jgi:hypothetical protein